MYDEEIERAILFSIIFDDGEYVIQEDDFINARNKKLAKAIIELRNANEDISMLSVQNRIKANRGQVLQYLSDLGNYYTKGINTDELYNKLIQLSQKRKLFDLLQKELINLQNEEEIGDYSQNLIKQINKIDERQEKEKSFLEKVTEATKDLEEKYNNNNDYSLYTGFYDLDDLIFGLHNQEFTIIGARPRCR